MRYLRANSLYSESLTKSYHMCLSKASPTKALLRTPEKFGQSNYKAAYGKIYWWLKRRWARLAVITAIETRYAGLGYFACALFAV